ncbi:Uncharacterized conserved protein, contains FIST_N domain [Acetitomaculum ruminis DSM 5522]|uniref:Uncharacterized conserved protein, contains FIST_N domain n=1 Tax=Acetitomaculum ruminis DSM 5522 TaxID=1120918 RepID=A0A1I0YUY5_9FIRM|nr:FIST N-terminal domain-containing protein [Acetitomaculum ruminis]SFB17094.1 Uncharacterized conserved protein, contains FIST_N domain [Acetitomaculum ruminis DSM 5522]
MQIKIGFSEKADVKAAVEEATSGISSVKGLLFQCDHKAIKEVAKLLSQKYPKVPLIGAGGATYYKTSVSTKGLMVLAFGSDSEIKAGILRHLSTVPLYDIADFYDAAKDIKAGKENTVCLEYCTNNEEKLVSTMNVVLENTTIPLLGGTVYGYPENTKPVVCFDGKLYEDACCWIIIKNKSGNIRTYKENIYGFREDGKLHFATKVNVEKRELIQLDNRPMKEVYAQEMGVSKEEVVGCVFEHPLGRIVGDDLYIISQYEDAASGGVITYKQVNDNDSIAFLELKDYEKINEETLKQIEKENSKISLVFSINCAFRHILFEEKGYTSQFLTNMSKLGPHIGGMFGGEQYIKQHVNQTMICAVFE